MRIGFLPNDFAGMGYYRCLLPAEALRKLGHDARMLPFVNKGRGDDDRFKIVFDPNVDVDVLVVGNPLSPAAWSCIGDFKRRRIPVVVDVDDDYLFAPDWNPASRNPQQKRVLRMACATADLVTVTTDRLAEVYAYLNDHVAVLPNRLSWDMWKNIQPRYELERKHGDPVRVGWYGGFDTRQGDLDVLKPWLGDWLREHRQVKFVAAGPGALDTLAYLDVPSLQGEALQQVDFTALPQILKFDIGVVPLADHPFNDGKSHLKGMEMNAAGIPFVASPTRPYRDWAYGTGKAACFLAENPEAWKKSLNLLLDTKNRRQMGADARRAAKTQRLENHAHRWVELYNQEFYNQQPAQGMVAV